MIFPFSGIALQQPANKGWGKHGGLNLNLGRLFQPKAQFFAGSGALLVEGQDDGTGVGSERAWRGEVTDIC